MFNKNLPLVALVEASTIEKLAEVLQGIQEACRIIVSGSNPTAGTKAAVFLRPWSGRPGRELRSLGGALGFRAAFLRPSGAGFDQRQPRTAQNRRGDGRSLHQ